jgi:hypothetical protein
VRGEPNSRISLLLHPGYGPPAGRKRRSQEAQVPNRFDEEKGKRIESVRNSLADMPDGESLAAFAGILFEHAAGEDLIEYETSTLAEVSREAYAFFRQRSDRWRSG